MLVPAQAPLPEQRTLSLTAASMTLFSSQLILGVTCTENYGFFDYTDVSVAMSLPPLVPSPGAQQQQQQQQLQQQLLQQLQQPLQPPQQPTLPLDDGSVGIRPAAVTNKRRGSLIDTIGTLMSPLDHHDSQRRRLISPSLDDRGRVASSSSVFTIPC